MQMLPAPKHNFYTNFYQMFTYNIRAMTWLKLTPRTKWTTVHNIWTPAPWAFTHILILTLQLYVEEKNA